MSVADSTDNTVNPSASSTVVITTVDSIADVPMPAPAARTAQQHIIPNAVQDRFINIVQQWPTPVDSSLVTSDDLKTASSSISNFASVAAFNFIFQNASTQPVFVEWCGTLFIDGTDPVNAYPDPGQTTGNIVAPTDWSIESYKAAYFSTGLPGAAGPFLPNQVNQDSQWFIVKFLGTGVHFLTIQYYWRTIVNQGGSATPATLSQNQPDAGQ